MYPRLHTISLTYRLFMRNNKIHRRYISSSIVPLNIVKVKVKITLLSLIQILFNNIEYMNSNRCFINLCNEYISMNVMLGDTAVGISLVIISWETRSIVIVNFVAMNYRKYDTNKIYKTHYNALSGTNAMFQGIHLNTDLDFFAPSAELF